MAGLSRTSLGRTGNYGALAPSIGGGVRLMILREDRFSEKVSPYLRPNVPYVCGRAAAWGKPCHHGPNANGTCGGTSECHPYNENGRWLCRRPPAAGGPCSEGPMPDGACCKTLVACQPRRTVRKVRGRVSVMVAAIVIAAIATFGFEFGDNEQVASSLDAGPLSSIHQNFTAEKGCNSCHSAHGTGAMGWVNAALTTSGPSDNCTNCHQFNNPVNGAHNSAVIASKHPQNTSCTMCHTEHKGANANIITMNDAQCNSCHEQKISSFAGDHKAFSKTYPFGQRTAIAFNHSSHFSKHFKDARYAKNVPGKGCTGCHDAARAERAVPVRGFDETCAGCHQDTVASRPFVMFTFPELEKNPFKIEDIIESPGGSLTAAVKATAELQGKVEKLAEASGSDPGKVIVDDMKTILADLGDRIGEIEADEEYEPISSETLTPVSAELMGVNGEEIEEYAEATETLVSGILEDGVAALSELVNEAGGNPDTLLRGLSNDTVGPAFAAWAANKEYEPIGDTIEKGWYANELSLVYRASAHSDPVMKAWLDFAARKGTEPMSEALLSSSDGAGACTKCHAVSLNKAGKSTSQKEKGKLKVEWKSHPSDGSPLVKYSHKPHINLLGPGTWCTSCHKINEKSDFSAAFKQLDPNKFSSNFSSVAKGTCVECHGGGQVSQQCLTCHEYHQEPGFKKTMMKQVAKK